MMNRHSIDTLIDRLDADVRQGDESSICAAVKRTLIDEIGEGRLELPAELTHPAPDDYARRLLHKCDEYAVVIASVARRRARR